MRSLRGVGVLFSLLIVGVLGGLMVPLPSDAQVPTKPSVISVKLKVDACPLDPSKPKPLNCGTNPEVEILGSQIECPVVQTLVSGGKPVGTSLGWNWCYALAPSGQDSATGKNGSNISRKYSLVPLTAGTTARLYITDYKNSNGVALSNFKVVPFYSTTTDPGKNWKNDASDEHNVEIKVEILFDSWGNGLFAKTNNGSTTTASCNTINPCASNIDDAGNRTIGFRAGGKFEILKCGTLSCVLGNTVGSDTAHLSVVGNFSPLNTAYVVYNASQDIVPTDTTFSNKPRYHREATNSTLLSGTTYSLYDRTTLPTVDCRLDTTPGTTGYTICKPRVIFTNQYFSKGPDMLNVTATHVMKDYSTNICFKSQGPPTNNPNNPCKPASGKKNTTVDIGEALAGELSDGAASDNLNNVSQEFPLGVECGLNNPNCRYGGEGAYNFVLKVTPNNKDNQQFFFKASGNGLGAGDDPFIFSVTPSYQTIVFPDGTSATGWYGVPDAETKAKLSQLPTLGGQWRFDVNEFPSNPTSQHKWTLNSWGGSSKIYGTLVTEGGYVTSDSYTFWVNPSGCNKMGMDLLSLQGNDIFTGLAHIHYTAINSTCE